MAVKTERKERRAVEDRRRRQWPCVLDMITDSVTGKLRESALFSVLCKLFMLAAYAKFVNAGNYETMSGVLGLALLGHEAASRFASYKTQQAQKAP